MKKISIPLYVFFAAALSACGSDFEWFPDYIDEVPPVVTGSVGGINFSNNTTIYPTLPNSATLIGTDLVSEPVSIYYTTNGSTPTTSSNLYSQSFTVEDNTWTLIFFGEDKVGNKSNPITVKFKK